MKVLFISGTDTGIGKTAATAALARKLAEAGENPVTQKLVQTGCEGVSEDIISHRKIMGSGLLPEDLDFTTCPYVLKYPASPHLACAMEGVKIDFAKIDACTKRLSEKYSSVLIEGVGGLMVPLAEDYLVADFVADRNLPLVLVVPSRLGSLSHALLNFEVCERRGISVAGVVYNTFPAAPKEIENSTRDYLKRRLFASHPSAFFEEIGEIKF
ncbi:MAG: dethiobiotin synthase [Verrucomicrobia bacterium CAG:312_58_20]|nr:MAG: dethiobiotin synthase [Verrucomicrobia bacterium CAG:312_58_20]PWL63945.1 MAG: dethiobiotin synthase [Verrucomicrobiota bacterium]